METMDAIAISLGYTVMAVVAVCIIAGCAFGAASLMIRAQHALLDSIGGWKTFLEYREWYHEQRRPRPAKPDAEGEQ